MTCRKCGGPLPARSGPGRPRVMCLDCNPPRKTRRGTLAAVADLPRSAPVDVEPPASVREAVVRELESAGRRWSSAGMRAVLLAERLADAAGEPGSAVAQIDRQLAATMAEALADADTDGLDDLDRLLADA